MNIGLDLDGVIYDWHHAVYTYLVTNKKNWSVSEEELWRDPYKYLPESEWSYIALLPTLYYTIIPSEKILQTIRNLDSEKNNIYYITNRYSEDVKRVTEKYLKDYSFPQAGNLIFTDDKSQMARILEIDVFVEDKPKNLESLVGLCRTIGIEQLWNEKEREYLESLGVLFIPSIECLEEIL
jgi:uncharacterized HAD superfamily protein